MLYFRNKSNIREENISYQQGLYTSREVHNVLAPDGSYKDDVISKILGRFWTPC